MLTEAINTAIEAGAQPQNILVRGDSAFCAGKIIAVVVKAAAKFSFAIARNSAVDAAINSIPDEAFVAVQYPGAVEDPDTGDLISDAQVSTVEYTAFAGTPYEITATLVVRRVLDATHPGPAVPGLALTPALHQQHRTDHAGRHHPPRPRHLRNRLIATYLATVFASTPVSAAAQCARRVRSKASKISTISLSCLVTKIPPSLCS